MKKDNAILFHNVDREDGCLTGGSLVFKVNNTKTYEDSYNELKSKLESPEMIAHIIEDGCLLYDLFGGDKTYKFKRTYWKYNLYYIFENSLGYEVEYSFQAQYITIVE